MTALAGRRPGESGSASLELALVTPVLLLLLLFITALGRLGATRSQIDAAAAQAARAASIGRTATDATAQARESLSAATSAGLPCTETATGVDVSRFGPGGLVVVELTCRIELSAVSGIAIPGSKLLQSRAVAVVDAFRGVG